MTAFLAFVGGDIDGFVLLTGRRVLFARDSGAQARGADPSRSPHSRQQNDAPDHVDRLHHICITKTQGKAFKHSFKSG